MSILYCYLLLMAVSVTIAELLSSSDVDSSNYKEHGVDGQKLRFDGKTRRYIPPDFPDLPKEESDKLARDLSIYSPWADKYCKKNYFESSWPPFTAHFSTKNWCRFLREDNRWQDLCCDGSHCYCDPVTGWGCWCHKNKQTIQSNSLDLEPTSIQDIHL